MASVILAVMWQGIPFFAVTLLAGLQAIPTELYDYEHPDEFRRPWDDPEIDYDWEVQNG